MLIDRQTDAGGLERPTIDKEYTFSEWMQNNDYWSDAHKRRIKFGFVAWLQRGARAGEFAKWLSDYSNQWSDTQYD